MLVTLTIGALLVVSIAGTARAMTDARRRVEDETQRLSAARHAMETIVGALRNIRRIAPPPRRDQPDTASPRPVLIGQSNGHSAGNDVLHLLINSDRRARPDGAESDQQEVSFYLQRREGGRWPALLCRRDHGLDDDATNGGIATVVADGIVALSFEYKTQDRWVDEWSALEPRTPDAVRVTVTTATTQDDRHASDQPQTVTLMTIVAIPHVRQQHAEEQTAPQRPRAGGPQK